MYTDTMNNTVLLIEEDDESRKAIGLILNELNCSVVETNSTACLADIVAYSPRLVLLDQYLTNASGDDLCREVKDNRHTKHTPVILISPAPTLDMIAKDCGADDILKRPVDAGDLKAKVRKWLGSAVYKRK